HTPHPSLSPPYIPTANPTRPTPHSHIKNDHVLGNTNSSSNILLTCSSTNLSTLPTFFSTCFPFPFSPISLSTLISFNMPPPTPHPAPPAPAAPAPCLPPGLPRTLSD